MGKELRQFPLSQSDAGELLTLQRAAYTTEAQIYGDPFLPPLTQSLSEIERELLGPGLGVRLGTRLVGAVRWTVKDSVAHIGRLTVAPDLQGKGIGTRLLREAEASSGASSFVLFTGHLSEANIRLYRREGYVFDREEVISDRVTLVHMKKARDQGKEIR